MNVILVSVNFKQIRLEHISYRKWKRAEETRFPSQAAPLSRVKDKQTRGTAKKTNKRILTKRKGTMKENLSFICDHGTYCSSNFVKKVVLNSLTYFNMIFKAFSNCCTCGINSTIVKLWCETCLNKYFQWNHFDKSQF